MRIAHARSKAALAALLAACALPAAARAQQDFASVEIRTVEAAPGVYMLVGRGGNIGVSVGPDGAFLIDDQYAPLTPKIRAAVAELSDEPIRFVLNTHWHGDHTGGNENLGEAGALIVAHDAVRERMAEEQVLRLRGRTVPPAPDAALPALTFRDALTFHWNGQQIHAFHVEHAHTDGDAIVHFRDRNALHMGDTYFSASYPFIDVDTGGSVDGTIAAAELGLELADGGTAILPGHGPLSDRAGLSAYRDMLVAVRDRVRSAIEAGRSADEVVAAAPTADFDERWGGGFLTPEQFVRIVYASLERDR